METKECNTCHFVKLVDQFGAHYCTFDRLNPKCKTCVSLYNKQYRINNIDHIKNLNKALAIKEAQKRTTRTLQWIKDNPERKKQLDKEQYETRKAEGRIKNYYIGDNVPIIKVRSKMWRQMNQGKVNAILARRRADILRATPVWAEYNQIVDIYIEARRLTEITGINYEVDHIIPLNSDVVCGLHCMDNLQILTADENNRKKCKFAP